jgi:hypothetical protein
MDHSVAERSNWRRWAAVRNGFLLQHAEHGTTRSQFSCVPTCDKPINGSGLDGFLDRRESAPTDGLFSVVK